VKQAVGIDGGVGAMTLLAGSTATEQQDRSRVVCLLNMVTHDELLDNEEYEGVYLIHCVRLQALLTYLYRHQRIRARGMPEIRPHS
jgi:hypothetical protein